MKYIKLYESFINETVLISTDEFSKVLSRMSNDLASYLNTLLNRDIKTNYNALKLTDKNDQIEFTSNNQYIKLSNELDKYGIFKRKGNTTSVGRLVRSILNDNSIKVSDKEIEEFVNAFKASYDAKDVVLNIQEVSGEDLRKWYHEGTYYPKSNTELGNSCMRYNQCQKYLDIYVLNPEVCKLIIYVNENNHLLARALFWKVTKSNSNYDYYLDRIYITDGSQRNIITDWVKNKYSDTKIGTYYDRKGEVAVKLENFSFDYYPYVDSLCYLNSATGLLSSNSDESNDIYTLQNTDGSYDEAGRYCEFEDQTYPEEECVWSEYHSVYIHQDNARYSTFDDETYWYEQVVYSRYLEDFLLREKACWSKHLKDWLSTDSYLVYLNIEKTESDYYPEDDLNTLFHEDKTSGEFYISSLLTEYDGDYYLTNNMLSVYEVNYRLETGGTIEFMTKEDCDSFNIYGIGEIKIPSNIYHKQLFTNVVYDKIKLVKGLSDDFLKRLEEYNSQNLENNKFKDKNYYWNNWINKYYDGLSDAKNKIHDRITKIIKELIETSIDTYPKELQKEINDTKKSLINGMNYRILIEYNETNYHFQQDIINSVESLLVSERSGSYKQYFGRLFFLTKVIIEHNKIEPNIIDSIKAIYSIKL